jgi:hypothetical protein
MSFIAGRYSLFVLLAFTIVTIVFAIRKSQKGEAPKIRRIAGLDSIEEALGRATEMGRPVHYTPGCLTLPPIPLRRLLLVWKSSLM